ncbi:kinase-like domain-containing protein [Amylocarpus encephaloides]|uniref:non-specific serine/threonine protein kinase n=1 Tax=Amylocarpus encephaloides TaxID=45428 RepID=A0A9P8C780_9HELO|nr:kinase-like domain-containing protein [Amylocarpus encephaloides]
MDGRLQVRQPEMSLSKMKAVEDARQMQNAVTEMCRKANKPPPIWVLCELIGKGTFGRVYMGKDMSTAKVVAVKIIDIDESDTLNPRQADTYSEFLKEINALKILSENKARNINHVIAAEPVGTAMWMVTEYCAGGSIATLMKPTAPGGLQERWIIPIVREVAEAIKWVHQADIIHRDIKCANVLITEEGQVQLCDFGVAGVIEDKFDKRSTIIGTPHWMAPELFNSQANYGKEVDIWAFGSMIFELATGLPPNVAKGIVQYHELAEYHKQHVPRLEGGNYSQQLEDIVEYLLQETPSERPRIEQVQKHPYVTNTEGEYPTSSLSNLVIAFKQWIDHGGSRKSLFMAGGAQGPAEVVPAIPGVGAEDWNFSTTQAFDYRVSQHIDPKDVLDVYGENVVGFDTARPKPSRRRPPPQALAPLPPPLVKVFDPNTVSNYFDHSQKHYGNGIPEQYQNGGVTPSANSDLPLRDDSARAQLRDTMIDLGGHDMSTGLSSFPEMDTMRSSNRHIEDDNGYSNAQDFHRPSLSDPADINPNRRTQDWKFPSFAPPASADPETSRFPSTYELPRPSMTPGAGGRPPLIHHPTEPLGGAFGAVLSTPAMDRPESLIDLDFGNPGVYPEIVRPSTANSEAGSTTSEQTPTGNPFEFERHASYLAPVEREPSLYNDDRRSLIDLDAALTPPRDLPGDLSDFSEPENRDPNEASRYEAHGFSDSEYMMPPPLPPANPDQVFTMAHFPALPNPPSAAALAGTASREEMINEVSRALLSMTGQLEAFRDVYESSTVTKAGTRRGERK